MQKSTPSQLEPYIELNFTVMCNPEGVQRGCMNCRQVIDEKCFYIHVVVDKKVYYLSNIEEFRCPHCGVQKNMMLTFDTDDEAFAVIDDIVSNGEMDGSYSLPLIDPGTGIKLSSDAAKNAHLN